MDFVRAEREKSVTNLEKTGQKYTAACSSYLRRTRCSNSGCEDAPMQFPMLTEPVPAYNMERIKAKTFWRRGSRWESGTVSQQP